jgi:hypothetical protein
MVFGTYWPWFFAAGVVGIALSIVFIYFTLYYTDYTHRPVLEIVKSSLTGPATNIISGMALAFETTALPAIAIGLSLILANKLGEWSGVPDGGLYGTAIATMGMLATCAYILAMDTFGPIVDNAGGIVEMSGESEETEKRIARQRLEIPTERFTILLLSGGFGVGRVHEIAGSVVALLGSYARHAFNLLVVCGRNDRLRTDLEHTAFPRNVHALETDLERKGAVVEKADVVRLEVSAQLPAETLDDRAVVREPVVAPYFLQPIHEFFQGRKIGSRHQDGLVERLGKHFQNF